MGNWSAPVKSKQRRVSFADAPVVNPLAQWYYVNTTPSRGKYKPIRRRSHTITNSQFKDDHSSDDSDPLYFQVSDTCSRHRQTHGIHSTEQQRAQSCNRQRRRSMGSLNVPVRKKMRMTLAKQLSLDIPAYPPSFVKAKRRRSSSISKRSKKRKYQADKHNSCGAVICTVL